MVLVGKLMCCTFRKCKNGSPGDVIFNTIQKMEKLRHAVNFRQNVRTSPKWKHVVPFRITNFGANINPF